MRVPRRQHVPSPDGWRRLTPADVLAIGAFVLVWGAIAIFGGSARPDVAGLVIVRPIIVLFLLAALILPGPLNGRAVRVPLLLLAALALAIAVQLIPLPPGLNAALPGRDRYAGAVALAGAADAWRPLSVTPDRTWNSLIALLPALAVLLGYARLPPVARRATLPALLVLGMASALLGIVQMLGGEGSALYVYRYSHTGYPVGLFANRNHQAALLDMLLPAASAWSVGAIGRDRRSLTRIAIAAVSFVCVMPVLLLTQSRAGLALLPVALVAAVLIPGTAGPRLRRGRWLALAGGFAVAGAFVGLTLLLGRGTGANRLLVGGYGSDARFDFAPVVIRMIRASLPFGFGFGSFDPIFRSFEPPAMLRLAYANNAHDDLLELLATGGLPALIVLLAFLGWIGRQTLRAVRDRSGDGLACRARAAATMIALVLLASLVDYPIRTPLMTAIVALLAAWLSDDRSGTGHARAGSAVVSPDALL